MTRPLLLCLLSAAALVSCKEQGGANADVGRAQAALDGKLAGRACTSLTKIRFVDAVEGGTDQFAKIAVLERLGAAQVTRSEQQGVKVTDVRAVDGAGGEWTEERDARYFCFGQWKVTEAQPSTDVPAPAGQDVLKIRYELVDAPDWVGEADALARRSAAGDQAYMVTINELGNPVPASYREANTAYVAVPKP